MVLPTGIDERAVAQVWERQAFDPSGLQQAGLRVLFRGTPSDAGGPDYQDAMLIDRDRRLVAGDVEFHVRSGDWFRHGHHRDRKYNGVVLHVVWHDEGRQAVRHDGFLVPTLELASSVSVPPVPISTQLLQHPCSHAFARLTPTQLDDVIVSAGRVRFQQRVDRFAADLAVVSPDQALYTGLLEACGYASNRVAFRSLAEAAPYDWIMSVPAEQRLASLLDAAGLGPPSGTDPPARLRATAWRLVRLRPANHPVRRLAGMVTVLDRHGARLADSFAETVCREPRPGSLRVTVQSTSASGGLGAGRADEMVVSVILPFVAALGHPEEAWACFKRYPSPPANRWTRRMLGMLQAGGHSPRVRTAVTHQGLHYLYHSYCRTERAEGCPVCGLKRVFPNSQLPE